MSELLRSPDLFALKAAEILGVVPFIFDLKNGRYVSSKSQLIRLIICALLITALFTRILYQLWIAPSENHIMFFKLLLAFVNLQWGNTNLLLAISFFFTADNYLEAVNMIEEVKEYLKQNKKYDSISLKFLAIVLLMFVYYAFGLVCIFNAELDIYNMWIDVFAYHAACILFTIGIAQQNRVLDTLYVFISEVNVRLCESMDLHRTIEIGGIVHKTTSQISVVYGPSVFLRRLILISCSIQVLLWLFEENSLLGTGAVGSFTYYIVAAYMPMYVICLMNIAKYEQLTTKVRPFYDVY